MKKSLIVGVLVILICIVLLILIGKEDNDKIVDNVPELEPTYDETDINEQKNITYTKENTITFGENITIPENVNVSNNIITINKEGTYILTGNGNARIVVDASESNVNLIFDNLTLSYTAYPIYVKNASKVVITLKENTINEISDTTNGVTDINGVIFSNDDLTINGEGKLIINAKFEDGIVSKDNLKIMNGTYEINAVDDGIRGTDSVTIATGTFLINASGDAIKSTKENDATKGYIIIENGTFNITSSDEAFDAITDVQIKNGTFNIKTTSGKGIKGDNNVLIEDGVFNINSSDDALHSNNSILIKNGTINISSGDDGIHANNSITIQGGNIDITKSYEGIEASTILINDGTIKVVASDDGINGAGGVDQSSTNRPGMGMFSSSTGELKITGGNIYVNSSGDGIDVNGSITMSGGTVVVDGPTSNGNGALDYDASFLMTGGTLIAAGSSGMVQTISNNSTINCASIYLNSTSEVISIQDSNGNNIVTFKPTKTISSLVVATSKLKKTTTYKIYTGGTVSGNASNGIYTNATNGGSLLGTITINNTVTTFGSSGNRNNRR